MRGALTKVEGLKDLETDISSRACSFKAPKDLNVAAKLNEIVAAGNTHVKGWAKN